MQGTTTLNFTVNCVHLLHTQHVRLYLPLPISATVSIFTVGVFIFLTLTCNIPTLFTVVPRHIIISPNHSIAYTAFLNPLAPELFFFLILAHLYIKCE